MKGTTIPELIDWLETKPADEAYKFLEPRECLLAQYFTAQGYTKVIVSLTVGTAEEPDWLIPDEWQIIAGNEAPQEEETFGHALERARAYA